MDTGLLLLTAMATVFAGASAIAAWASRDDALKSSDRAQEAEASALDAWRQSAQALRDANIQSERHHTERIDRERRIRRGEAAQPLGRILIEKSMSVAMELPVREGAYKEEREASGRLMASGEPHAFKLGSVFAEALKPVKPGDRAAALIAAANITKHMTLWIEDPESFAESVAGDFGPERVKDLIDDLVDSIVGPPPEELVEDPGASEVVGDAPPTRE